MATWHCTGCCKLGQQPDDEHKGAGKKYLASPLKENEEWAMAILTQDSVQIFSGP